MVTQVRLCPCGFGFTWLSFSTKALRRDIFDEVIISRERSPLTSSWITFGMERRINKLSSRS